MHLVCGSRKWGVWGGGAAALDEATALSYPPKADGLHPLHGAHVEDIHPVLAVDCDVGGATTWADEAEQVSPSSSLACPLRPRRHRRGAGACAACVGLRGLRSPTAQPDVKAHLHS